jgi:hypothetical protein
MQYFLCPRCQFRVPANKHSCQTCGYKIPSASSAGSGTNTDERTGTLTNPFAKLMGFTGNSKQKETGSEKPALS